MRVALVHDWLDVPGGGELVLARFMRLFPDADTFTLVDFLSDTERARIGLRRTIPTGVQQWPAARRWFRAIAVLYPQAIERIDLRGYDLVLSDSHAIAKGVRTHAGQMHICYCHTPARFAWDMADIYERSGPLRLPFAQRFASRAFARFRRWDQQRAQAVSQYIANSRHVAQLIQECYGRAAKVVYPPVEWDRFSLPSAGLARGDHYVTLTRLVPYKRIDLLIEAFRKMPDRELRIVGDGPEYRALRVRAPINVKMLGRLDDEDAARHVASARAFLHIAKEDFGIATVEAQGAGVPVIGYGEGGTAEIVRDLREARPTGVLFDEQSAAAIVAAVQRFEDHRVDINPDTCRENAKRFSPARFDREIMDIVDATREESSKSGTRTQALVR
ncbi:MAG TPA: glycosyltransferase [Casimicrobiaceae bacterium]|nr:glycosyltransferase [Casimicrobiaceae bacterium]